MAFAGGGLNAPSARESAPGGRFFFFALLSLLLMYFDQKDGWGERIRYVLQAVAYPIQVTVGSPGRLAGATADLFRTRASLREENATLQKRELDLQLRTQRFEALEQENAQLRGLTAALPALVSKRVLVDIVNSDNQRLVINKGDNAHLYRSQVLVDTTGLAGQLVRVGPWSAEVMLITDPEAGVPIVVLRSGERSIVMGTGSARELSMPFLPATADVKAGDLIVTSGLGGVFPAGIPVGKVIENKRDPNDQLAHVRVAPLAQLDRSRQLLALWFDAANPAAPAGSELLESLPPASIADPVSRGTPQKPAVAAPPAKKPAPPAGGPHPPGTRPAAATAPPASPKPAEPAAAVAPALAEPPQ